MRRSYHRGGAKVIYRINKAFQFSAAHRLSGLAADHPCGRNHGHNYEVEFELESAELNAVGFVKDYRELDPIKKWIDETLDHRDLTEVLAPMQPSAELIAKFMYDCWWSAFPQLSAVRVKETAKTMAEYRP
jgi:6-pyruvoyltetrahydropterin/6-carboxytetrahydropterin synthase